MPITFGKIIKGSKYSRKTLAEIWGYASFHAIARGVVTPRFDNKIILFVTEEKKNYAEQYNDLLEEDILKWEGPTDHFAEDRMVNADKNNEEIHLFYRKHHHGDFVYYGRIKIIKYNLYNSRPSQFEFVVF